jgi:uncharacterized protein YigE (DUF2233 family)
VRKLAGLLIGVLAGLLVGCGTDLPPTPIMPSGSPVMVATAAITEMATAVPPPITTPAATAITPASTPIPDTGWQPIQPGLEQRTIHLFNDEGTARERLLLLRLEPEQFIFRVGYRPGAPQALPFWQAETGALLVVNGGYFTEEFLATGLVIVEGQASGVSYGDFAGMLAISEAGPEVRWLRERPFTPDEPLLYALQSFPILVRPDGQPGFPEEDGRAARRTAIGQDENGRLLFIFAPWGSLTLHQFSRLLAESDLDLRLAFNLDGGPSTGMILTGETPLEIPAFSALPIVITVHEQVNR